jgi:hypothetical protein
MEVAMAEPLAYRPAEALQVFPIGRTALYELLKTGEIESFRVGRARFIPAGALSRTWTGSSPRNGRLPSVPDNDERRALGPGAASQSPPPPRDSSGAIVADARDARRARTVRRLAAVELTRMLYGGVPAAQWCSWCRGRCKVVVA